MCNTAEDCLSILLMATTPWVDKQLCTERYAKHANQGLRALHNVQVA